MIIAGLGEVYFFCICRTIHYLYQPLQQIFNKRLMSISRDDCAAKDRRHET
jgi:hypothetical protein